MCCGWRTWRTPPTTQSLGFVFRIWYPNGNAALSNGRAVQWLPDLTFVYPGVKRQAGTRGSTEDTPIGVTCTFHKHPEWQKLWMHSKQSKCFWKGFYDAWPFGSEPSRHYAVPNEAMYSATKFHYSKSSRPSIRNAGRDSPNHSTASPHLLLFCASTCLELLRKICCKLTLIIPEEGHLPFSSVTFLKQKKTDMLYYPIVRFTRKSHDTVDTFLRTSILWLLVKGTSQWSRLTKELPGSHDIYWIVSMAGFMRHALSNYGINWFTN